ncbi:ABC transporter ATP-binding protein [Azoarcus sp. DN11]|uniref:ABC transporter ATP-binding protein n=1 Tax=Azoarcus sp. DN11 TaxID=356837 RepID=UPI000EAC8AEF|nr:ABC transporter ATP-binding protein [Azoarcus sp. DN11]AYH43831.1 high-affinity branched-chain amino acid ABC transporter ATP-binding protein LivG [Azoarcus sp. DN11]
MLEVLNLSKTFGGVAAVRDVSFTVRGGSVHSVIGPNGAGKTTLFNLVSGVYTPSSGEIRFEGENVAGLGPDLLARRGMSRTFQNLQICMNMTACENVMLGAHLLSRSSLLGGMLGFTRRADRALRDEARHLMDYVGVGAYVDAHATQLSFGVLKRLEIARALAGKPRLLLLDEPAAGLNDTETHQVSELIRSIAASGITVVLVEHDMKMVMNISDHILVLDYGKKLAEGTSDEVRSDPRVIAAYLGTE